MRIWSQHHHTPLLASVALLALLAALVGAPRRAFAQDQAPNATPDLLVYTQFPSQTIGLDENPSLDIYVRSAVPQTVALEVVDAPADWTVNFRGSNRIVQSVFADGVNDAKVSLRVEQSPTTAAGEHTFTVVARGENGTAELPITFTVKERVPANLAFDVELANLRGKPGNIYRYNVTLVNGGDEDLNVDLSADAPDVFQVRFMLSGQEVTTLPVEANTSKRLSVEASSLVDLQAGVFPITIHARGGDAQADADLTAEVVGQPTLTFGTFDGRLSGEANAGDETTYSLQLANTGSAPAKNIEFSASPPNGWTVTMDPETVESLEPGQQAEVVAHVRPADKAVAGDYMLTFRARPAESTNKSIDYRVTVTTSTLWGIVGVALIAIAVAVVALAVMRFGRR